LAVGGFTSLHTPVLLYVDTDLTWAVCEKKRINRMNDLRLKIDQFEISTEEICQFENTGFMQ
jgi:hypothetical protein